MNKYWVYPLPGRSGKRGLIKSLQCTKKWTDFYLTVSGTGTIQPRHFISHDKLGEHWPFKGFWMGTDGYDGRYFQTHKNSLMPNTKKHWVMMALLWPWLANRTQEPTSTSTQSGTACNTSIYMICFLNLEIKAGNLQSWTCSQLLVDHSTPVRLEKIMGMLR